MPANELGPYIPGKSLLRRANEAVVEVRGLEAKSKNEQPRQWRALGRVFAAERNARDWRTCVMEMERQLCMSQTNTASMEALIATPSRASTIVLLTPCVHIFQHAAVHYRKHAKRFRAEWGMSLHR